MRLVRSGSAEVAVFDSGAGDPPLLFIHGWACDHSAWDPQVTDLSRDHRCVSIDLRGRGASPVALPCDIVTAVDDVAAVARELAIGPAVVVGHSLGGLIALVLGDRHPELVLGSALGDSPIGNRPGARGSLGERIRVAGSMEPARALIEGFFVDETPDHVREQVLAMMLSCPPDIAAGMLDNEHLVTEWDRLIRVADAKPFMAIWAERPLGNPARLRELTTFLRQEPLAGAGHFFELEKPEITNALLRAFLDDVARDPRVSHPGQPG